ncbi:MAG: acyl-CoA synthetase [Microscillaceae bacterium]|nr:acyl-CoA synthetase [Microscillaceae bacterium]
MIQIKTIEDILKIEENPLEQHNLPRNTYEMLQRGAGINPDKTALRFFLQGTNYSKSADFSFRDLIHRINQTANMFQGLGLGTKEVVAFVLPNLPETHFTIWGGEAAGIVCAVNPMLEPQQIADILKAAEAKILVTLAPFPKTDLWDKVESIIQLVPSLKTVLTVDLGIYLGSLKRTIVKLINKKPRSESKVHILDFHKTMSKYPADRLSFERDIQPDDIASYFHTGGTTGTPKIARHSHFNEVFDAWSAGQNIGNSPDRVLFCGLPLFHVNGVIVTGLIPWSAGATVVLGTPQGYRGEGVFANFWKIVSHYKVNFFSGVPTVYQMLLNIPIGKEDISSLDFAICGAAPMPVELFKTFQEKTGVKILEGYGLTEGACASSANPAYGEKKIGSIGMRIPYQEMKTLLLDDEGKYLRDCETDEIGIVAIRGANVFKGYKEEVHNKHVFIDTHDGKGPWLNTGDLGRMDKDAYFWLTGRKKELIIRGGHNIDPKMIEEPMHLHPDVALAAAVGRPDPRVGEVPVVYIQAKPGSSPHEDELLQFAKDNIGERAAQPKAVRIIDQMPVTAVGKIFKPQLVWKEIEEVYTIELDDLQGIIHKKITVGPDKIKGMVAQIHLEIQKDAEEFLKKAIQEKLGAYSIAYELTFQA